MLKKTKKNKTEKMLFSLAIVLTLFGLIMVASAGAIYGETRFDDQWFFVTRQSIAALIGIAAMMIVRHINYHIWQKFAVVGFILAVGASILVFVPGIGRTIYGASRWVDIGPISFQPAEFLKLALIFYFAAWLSSRGQKNIRDIYDGLVPFVGIVAFVAFIVIKQPDVGTLGVIIATSFAMFFVSGARTTHLLALVVAGIGMLVLLIKAAPYRMNRFLVFLDPERDPQGIGYQITQSLIAVGAGGIFGRGLGHGLQKFNYLPEPAGDSIFAVISEELGFVGAVAILIAILVFAFLGYRTAQKAPDMFGRLLAVGITTWIVAQSFFNIAAITALMPLTGIPLPFISYGSSALIIVLFATGVLINVAHHSRR